MTKLSDAQVRQILKLKDKPDVYATDIAKKFGVSPSLISRIWNGKRRTKSKETK